MHASACCVLSGVLFRTDDGISSIPPLDFDFNSNNTFFTSNRDVGFKYIESAEDVPTYSLKLCNEGGRLSTNPLAMLAK